MSDLLGLTFCVFIVLAGIFAPMHYMAKNSCENYKEMTGRETIYKTFDACYIEYNGRFWRWSEYMAQIKTVEIVNGSEATITK